MSSENIVKLNIGGTVFQTAKSTLTKFDGMFKTMLETSIPIAKDDSGCIFVDRDPRHFHVILNFMRDGEVDLPGSEQELKAISREAQYYLLDSLVEMCEEKLQKMTEAKNKPVFDEEVQILDTHGQLLRVIADPKKPVLVIYYHIDSAGRTSIPEGFFIKPFLDRHKNKLDIYFKSFTNTQAPLFTKPSRWIWSLHNCTGWSYTGTMKKNDNWPKLLENAINSFIFDDEDFVIIDS